MVSLAGFHGRDNFLFGMPGQHSPFFGGFPNVGEPRPTFGFPTGSTFAGTGFNLEDVLGTYPALNPPAFGVSGRARNLQLMDLLSSQQLRRALLPGEAGLELSLRNRIIPAQLMGLGRETALATNIFGDIALGAQQRAFSDPLTQGLLGATTQGLEGLAAGGLPPDVQRTLENAYFSTAGALGLQGQAAALQPLTGALGSQLTDIQERIRSSRINQALGVRQGLGFLGARDFLGGGASLLGSTGLPDIGLSPFDFETALGINQGAIDALVAHRQRREARRAGITSGVIGSVTDILSSLLQGGNSG